MMREAESHADEDRKRKEEIETRNQADQAAYAAEGMLKEAGDKISASDRQPVEAAIEELKKAIEKNDVAEMKRAMEALNTAQHKAAEAMYKSRGAAGGGGRRGGGQPAAGPAAVPRVVAGRVGRPEASGGDVIDAEVVEEEKK